MSFLELLKDPKWLNSVRPQLATGSVILRVLVYEEDLWSM